MTSAGRLRRALWRGYVQATPPSLRLAMDLRRRKPWWEREGVLFIHVPKAAGTSVSKALYGRSLGHFYAADVRRAFPSAFDHWFSFSLVRNPWARLLSAYVFARTGRTESAGVYQYQRYLADPRFHSFERFVLEWLPEADLANEDNIFREQWRYLCDEDGTVLLDHVGRVENMDDTIALLEERLGRHLVVGHSNVLGAGNEFRQRYTKEMIRTVGDIYARDIDLLGYDF